MYYIYGINFKYLSERIAGWPSKSQILYGLLCCERMFPNFCKFSMEAPWKQPNDLRVYLDIIWNYLEGKKTDRITSSMYADLMELAPDVDDAAEFQSELVSAALDAVSATAELYMAFAETNDFVDAVVGTVQLSVESVEMNVNCYYGFDTNIPDNSKDKSLTKYIDNPLVDVISRPVDDPWSIVTMNHPIVHRELTLLWTTLDEVESGNDLSYMKSKYRNCKYGSLCYKNENGIFLEYPH